jgi:hypothetical protein
MGLLDPKNGMGSGNRLMVPVAVAVQVSASPVTVYTVVMRGDAVKVLPVRLPLQV